MCLQLPRCLKCGFHQYLQEAEVWLSSGGTSSLLHSHADQNIHCLLSGRKDFILIERKYRDRLEYHDRVKLAASVSKDLFPFFFFTLGSPSRRLLKTASISIGWDWHRNQISGYRILTDVCCVC